ncbi:MAG TPA: SBBP repeat-containing protein, partial [Candidatus Angelobacter sp.]|nr:SBBP repeat-containing protein [Candidatus Angelobacter sp.]
MTALALKFAGAAGNAFVVGAELSQAKTNYFLGNDPAQWRRGVPNYGRVEYHGLYPGIDAVFHGESQRLEFDFVVAPGANPGAIALEVYGAHKIRINRAGDIELHMDRGREIVLGKPRVYQDISGERREVTARFLLRGGNRIGFSIDSYNHSLPLIIDPTLVYSTFVGPTQGSFNPGGISSPVNGVAVDASGFAYVVGTTDSPFFPIVPTPVVQGTPPNQYYALGAYEPVCEGCDNLLYSNPQSVAFVAKFDPTKSGANSLIYSTYLGPIFFPPLDEALERAGGMQYLPPSWASGSAIAVDPNGNAYVTGTVFANAARLGYFPTTSGALQPLNPGQTNGFISELDPTGEQLLHSTYFGGNNAGSEGGDRITAIALDGSDNVYIAGSTDSPNMSTQCALQPFRNGNASLFVAKLDPALGQLGYSTYFLGTGGYRPFSGPQPAKALAVDSAGEVYLVGGAYPPTPVSGNGSGSIGPGGGISVNPSCGFPYPNPNPVNVGFQTAPGTGLYSSYGTESESGFLAKLNASGTQLLYLTYLGGNLSSSQGYGTEMDAVALDPNGNAYIAGNTYETNLPVTAGVVGPNAGCTTLGSQTICSLNFLAEVNPAASGLSSLTFLTYLPQTLETGTATGVAVDQFGDILVAGGTSFNVHLQNVPNMPNPNGTTASATTSLLGGGENVATYLLELTPGATQILDSGYLGGDGKCSGSCYGVFDSPAGMALDTLGNVYLAGSLASNDFPTTVGAFQPTPLAKNSNPNGFLAKISTGPANQPQLTVSPPIGNFGNVPAGQSPQITLTVSNTGQAPLLIQGVTTTGPFTLVSNTINCNGSFTGTLLGSLSPGSSCTANVMFNSSSAGPYTGALVFVDNSEQGTPDPITPAVYNDQSYLLTAIAPATHFAVSAPASVNQGAAFNLVLTALNGSNTTATGYTGTVHFTSSDAQAALPADYTFTAADNGSHVFTTPTLNTLGSQTISTTDTAISAVVGISNGITVNPPPATYFVVSAPSVATVGTSFSFTVTANNALNTTATTYTGGVHFTSTDTQAALPTDYTFTSADGGTHVFTATLNTVGTQSITATDTGTSSINGPSNLIAVTAALPPPSVLLIDNEVIAVSDSEMFPDVFDSEAIKLTDMVTISPIINVKAPVAFFSVGSLGFGSVAAGQTGTQSITLSDIGQAPLGLSATGISPNPAFSISQIACSNGATSLPTNLPVGGACTFTIFYLAPSGPAPTTAITFTDNAALSNIPSAPSGSS